MSVADTARAVQRWWYVVLVGLVATAVACAVVLDRDGVYWARAELVLLPPTAPDRTANALAFGAGPLVPMATVVAQRVNGGDRIAKTASPRATLVGRGVRDGALVQVADYGGQWEVSYRDPVIVLDVAGPSEDVVRERIAALTAEVAAASEELQDELGVPGASRVRVEGSGGGPALLAPGSPTRAIALTTVLGAGGVLAVLTLLDLRRRRRA